MEKPRHNPLTLADLQAALTGLATKDDLKGLATQETVTTIMETVAELKESMTVVKETMNEMQGELTATHEDVRYANRVTTLFTSVGNEADRVGPT